MKLRDWSWVLFAVVGLASTEASAYTVRGGDMILRPVLGAAVNVVRLDVATRASPPAGMLLGVDFDYSFDGAWSLATSVRPVLSSGFVATELGVGVKYRAVALDVPFIPYASAMITGSGGLPMGYGDLHLGFGGRIAAGVDYFIRHDLALGVEVAQGSQALVLPIVAPEVTTSAMAAFSWKF